MKIESIVNKIIDEYYLQNRIIHFHARIYFPILHKFFIDRDHLGNQIKSKEFSSIKIIHLSILKNDILFLLLYVDIDIDVSISREFDYHFLIEIQKHLGMPFSILCFLAP